MEIKARNDWRPSRPKGVFLICVPPKSEPILFPAETPKTAPDGFLNYTAGDIEKSRKLPNHFRPEFKSFEYFS
jgi:hypothetical protein